MLEEKARYAKDMAFMDQQVQQKRIEKEEKAAADRKMLKEYQALLDRQDAARAQALADMHAKSQVRLPHESDGAPPYPSAARSSRAPLPTVNPRGWRSGASVHLPNLLLHTCPSGPGFPHCTAPEAEFRRMMGLEECRVW
jgi:hypothetical protein